MGSPHIVKTCAECKAVRSVEDFYATKKGKTKRDAYCKPCRRIRDRERSARKDRRRYDPEHRRDFKLRRLYGISLADYNAMAEAQNHLCGLCGEPEKRRMYGEPARLVVDHNHHTGKVRALLCASCNGRLAPVEDEQFMLLAKQYLRDHDGYVFVGDEP